MRKTLGAGQKLPSIRKFAKQWEVSTITVIKAFEKLKQDGFVTTNQRSGFFVSGGQSGALSSKKIGILSPTRPQDINRNKSLYATYNQLEKDLVLAGHRCSAHLGRWQSPDGGHAYLSADEINDYGLDAVVIMNMYNYHYLSQLAELRIPIMAIDFDASVLGIDSLYFDNTAAAMKLTNKLIAAGHKDILFIGGPASSPLGSVKRIYADPATLQRLDGCKMACDFSDHTTFHSAITRGARQGEEWLKLATNYITEHPAVTAIVCESKLQFDGELSKIEQAHFTSSRAEDNNIALARAFCDFEELGRIAPKMLFERFADPIAPAQRQSIAPHIIERNNDE